jgi:hypothetical protein
MLQVSPLGMTNISLDYTIIIRRMNTSITSPSAAIKHMPVLAKKSLLPSCSQRQGADAS